MIDFRNRLRLGSTVQSEAKDGLGSELSWLEQFQQGTISPPSVSQVLLISFCEGTDIAVAVRADFSSIKNVTATAAT